MCYHVIDFLHSMHDSGRRCFGVHGIFGTVNKGTCKKLDDTMGQGRFIGGIYHCCEYIEPIKKDSLIVQYTICDFI